MPVKCECEKCYAVFFVKPCKKPQRRFCSLKCKYEASRGNLKNDLTYISWNGMWGRCKFPSATGYHNYGGRGIDVCKEWESFDRFLADMGPRPSRAHSIDRIDNTGNYCKENCRWATRIEQQRNTSKNLLITINGETLCAAAWADKVGLEYGTVISRINKMKWSPVRAVTTPLHPTKGRHDRRKIKDAV